MSRRDRRDAVEGAIGGLAAGAVLTVAMLLAERLAGEPSDGVQMLRRGERELDLPHRQVMARPTLGEEVAAEGGHLLLSALLGAGFGVLRRGLGLPPQQAGLVLGLGFYPLAYGVVGPLLGLTPPPWREQPFKLGQRAVLHAVFGSVTALVADRLGRRR
jgi:hypothetical protein